MKIELLAERPHLVPAVTNWLFEQFSYLEPNDTCEIFENRTKERLKTSGCPVTFVSLEGEALTGTASLVEDDLDSYTQFTPWLADVYVHPSYRGRGHGKHLAHAVIEHAKRYQYPILYLYTHDQQAFFKDLGWVELLQSSLNGTPITIMKRAL